MPTPTYTPLATVTLGSTGTSVVFSNIPATYRDLILVCDYAASSLSYLQLQINSDTGTNYSFVTMYTDPAVVSTANTYDRFYLTTNTIQSGARIASVAQIMDYSATNKHKTVLSRQNFTRATGTQVVEAQASRWASTSAITSLQVSGGFSTGAALSLYGVIA
jgi:hypothetical protein